jgi:hypothetical protein
VSRTWVSVGVALALIGLVWVGQGLGYIGGSFMTGDPTWAVIGAVTAVAGGALTYLGGRR